MIPFMLLAARSCAKSCGVARWTMRRPSMCVAKWLLWLRRLLGISANGTPCLK